MLPIILLSLLGADGFTIQRAAPEFTIIRAESAKTPTACTCPKGGDCSCGPGCDCYQPIKLKNTGAGGATSSPSATDETGAVSTRPAQASRASAPRQQRAAGPAYAGHWEQRGLFGRRSEWVSDAPQSRQPQASRSRKVCTQNGCYWVP